MKEFSMVKSAARLMLIVGAFCLASGAARAQAPCLPTHVSPSFLDLSVVVDKAQTTCDHVTFRVTLSPPLVIKGRPVSLGVRVRVLSPGASAYPVVPVGEVLLLLPLTGGTATASISWPTPAGAAFDPDFSTQIIVVVDPDNEIAERDECNNFDRVGGTCLG